VSSTIISVPRHRTVKANQRRRNPCLSKGEAGAQGCGAAEGFASMGLLGMLALLGVAQSRLAEREGGVQAPWRGRKATWRAWRSFGVRSHTANHRRARGGPEGDAGQRRSAQQVRRARAAKEARHGRSARRHEATWNAERRNGRMAFGLTPWLDLGTTS